MAGKSRAVRRTPVRPPSPVPSRPERASAPLGVPLVDETEQNRRHLESALLLGARVLVGGIFLIAGVAKVGSPGAFAEAIRAFHILPGDLVMPFARIVPWLELLVAAYLLAGFLTRVGALGSCLLLGSFVYALADSLATGNTNHACGCFGSGAGATPILAFLAGGDTVTWWDVIRDLILIALSLLVLVRGAGALSLDGWLARRRDLAEEA